MVFAARLKSLLSDELKALRTKKARRRDEDLYTTEIRTSVSSLLDSVNS